MTAWRSDGMAWPHPRSCTALMPPCLRPCRGMWALCTMPLPATSGAWSWTPPTGMRVSALWLLSGMALIERACLGPPLVARLLSFCIQHAWLHWARNMPHTLLSLRLMPSHRRLLPPCRPEPDAGSQLCASWRGAPGVRVARGLGPLLPSPAPPAASLPPPPQLVSMIGLQIIPCSNGSSEP